MTMATPGPGDADELLIASIQSILLAQDRERLQQIDRQVGAFQARAQSEQEALREQVRKLKEDEEKKQEEIEDQQLVVEDCEARVALARREYIDAAKQLQVMEKHKELWQKKIKDELSKKEAKEMDELGATIHQLRRWRGEKSIME